MASRIDNLKCPICRDLFEDPVSLSCGHSLCKVCQETWWQHSLMETCPVCKRTNKRYLDGPPLNLALKNLVESYKQQPECSLHSEKLSLFCLDHQEPICLVCRDSNTHEGHRFSPIEEAAPDLRDQLRSCREHLHDQLKDLNKRRVQFDDTLAYITAQAELTKTQMRAQFQNLHLFLWNEEQSMKKALREEMALKTQNMKDKIATLSREIETMSKIISDIEEQLKAGDAYFLLQYKSAVEKVQRCPLVFEVPKMEQGALINQGKYLGNLVFNVWKNMKSLVQFYPVVLDPNTAGPDLVLSEDLSTARCGEWQKVPNNPERTWVKSVMGIEKFVSGLHSWDVDVRGSKAWVVGVVECRQERRSIWSRACVIHYTGKHYNTFCERGACETLSVKNLQTLRVKVNCDKKTVTFTDPDTNIDLCTFVDCVTGEHVPFFIADTSLKILPKNVTVDLD